jgi:hypothetical protein
MSTLSINTTSNTTSINTTTPAPPNTPVKMFTNKDAGLVLSCGKRDLIVDGFKIIDGNITDENNHLVCPGNNKMVEFSVSADNQETIRNHPFFANENFNNIKKYTTNDGTMIRLFFHNGIWKKATNRRVNADTASWGPVRSFGYLFDECAEYYSLDYSKLDTECSYSFVMNHPMNRIIEPSMSFPILYHVDTVHVKSGNHLETNIGIQQTFNLTYTNLDEMFKYLLNPDIPWMVQGFLLINSRNERLKLENPQYTHVHNLKGNIITETASWKMKENVHSYSFRLFQIIQESTNESEFLYYFPEHVQQVINIKENINSLSVAVWETYKQRYIFKNKEYPQDPKLQTFLNFLHYQYHTNHLPITFDKCMDAVKGCPTSKLMHTLGFIDYKVKEGLTETD